MDKLKSMMSSNKDKDTTPIDNTATGDLSNKNTVSGQGSHFGSGHGTDTNPLSSSANPTSATGSNLTGTGMQGLNEPHSSRMPGGFDDDTISTASVSSGIPGRGQTAKPIGNAASDAGLDTNKPLPNQPGTSGGGLTGHGMTGSGLGGSSSTSANPYSSSERGIDPRVDSDLSGRSGGLGSTHTGSGHGLTGNTSSGLGSNTAGTGLGNTTDTGRSFPLGGNSGTGTTTGSNTGYNAPGQVGTYAAGGGGPGRTGGSSGLTGNTTAGPHSSNLENKMDPRVDSDRDGRSGLGNTTGAGANSGLTGSTTAGPHSSNLENKMDPRVDSDRDGRSGLGNTTTGTTGTGYGSGTTGTGYGSGTTGTGLGSNTTAGPHSSNLENKLDPRVDSDRDGRSGLGNTTTGTGQTSHLGRDAALGAGAGATAAGIGGASHGPESWQHQHSGHSHNYEGDPCGPGASAPGGPSFTSGPHVTDTANRLDPHVNSGVGATGSGLGSSTGSGLGSSTGTGLGSSTTGTGLGSSTTGTRSGFGSTTTGSASDPYGSSSTGTGHHHGRDAALGAGAGAAGVGAYETGRGGAQSGSTGPAPTTAGPHKSDMLNKLDPRVDSDLSKQQSTSGTSVGGTNTTGPGSHLGSSTTGTSSDPYASSTTGTGQHSGHHTGRDAALAGGAGATGLGAYEAEKHHHAGSDPSGTSGLGSSTTTGAPHHSHHQGHHDRQQHASEHHLGRDAGLAGAGTAAAYEAERHHGHPTQSSTIPSTTGGMTSSSRDPLTSGHGNQTGTGHHLGRDAGLAGAGGVGAYEAEKHLGHHDTAGERLAGSGHHPNTNDPTLSGTQSGTTGTGHRDHHLGRDAALGAGAGGAAYEADKHHHNKHDPTSTTGVTGSQDPQHHYGRDAALGAGAAGAGYEADKHHHDKEAKKLEHEREKEAKHQDSGKKSGILGLFSRDKGDKEAHREERAEERAQYDHHTGLDAGVGAGAAGTAYEAEKHHHNRGPGNEALAPVTGGTGLESDMKNTSLGDRQGNLGGGHSMTGTDQGLHGSQAGVHDSAISSGSGVAGIGGGPTTHDAYGDQDPNRINRLHKDPPTGRGL